MFIIHVYKVIAFMRNDQTTMMCTYVLGAASLNPFYRKTKYNMPPYIICMTVCCMCSLI